MPCICFVLTLTLASVKLVHIAISSRVDMSGYRFRLNVCSSSCNCCEVKCVRCLRCRLFFLSFFASSPPATIESFPPAPPSWPGVTTSVLIDASFSDRFPDDSGWVDLSEELRSAWRDEWACGGEEEEEVLLLLFNYRSVTHVILFYVDASPAATSLNTLNTERRRQSVWHANKKR